MPFLLDNFSKFLSGLRYRRGNFKNIFKNTHSQLLFSKIKALLLQRFFIGYWILKTGLDFYPGPFVFLYHWTV
jgi:hypothetical protein